MNTLGDRIKRFVTARSGSQAAFCREHGINQAQLSEYVTNRVQPGIDVLAKFAAAGMSIDWLLTGEGEMERANRGGRLLYPSEVGPMGEIVGTVEVGDRRYGLVAMEEAGISGEAGEGTGNGEQGTESGEG